MKPFKKPAKHSRVIAKLRGSLCEPKASGPPTIPEPTKLAIAEHFQDKREFVIQTSKPSKLPSDIMAIIRGYGN